MKRLGQFLLGWRRRSAMMLDAAGCPYWLVKLRCPIMKGWGTMLRELAALAEGWRPETEEEL